VSAPVASHEEATRWSQATLEALTLERKVAQMLCEQMRGEYVAAGSPQLEHWLRLVREHGIGGFVVYGGSPHDTARLLNMLQRESTLPLLIAADFDRAIGIHLTYSPVVDVQTQPGNPVLSGRSFGADLDLLGRMAGAYIKGYQDNGMLATAKHYPGRGDVELIAGTEFTINRKPADQVEREDLRAFRHAIDAGVAFIMSEHIAVPSLASGSDLPASVERALATDWLRGKLGFTGVLTSDDLWYGKVTERFGAEQAGVLAVKAGHDALLKPADAIRTMAAVVAAVRGGEIPESRIDASVGRILYWKARLGLHRNRFVNEAAISRAVGVPAHQALVRTIAERSLTLLVNDGDFPRSRTSGTVLHVAVQKQDHDPAVASAVVKLREALPVSHTFVLKPATDPRVHYQALRAAGEVDTVVVSVFSPRTVYREAGSLREADLALIRDIIRVRPRSTVVMSYGNPYVAESLHGAAAFVVGYGEGGFYGNQLAYVDAFVRLMKGDIGTGGRLPVRVPPRFELGAGIVVPAAQPVS
jgi:beta-N-acetylhexosaminidase